MYVKLESGSIEQLRNKKVLLFGAGSLGLRSIEECKKINATILGFVDNNRTRRGEVLEGYTIYTAEDIKDFPDAYVLITSTYVEEIKLQLLEMGIDRVEVIRLGALRDTIEKEDFFKPMLDKKEANDSLLASLNSEGSFFVGRLGSNELECMVEYYDVLKRCEGEKNSYHDNLKLVMKQGAGFFPTTDECLDRFAELYTENLKDVDFIWSMWLSRFENQYYERFNPNATIGYYDDTALPYDIDNPWTRALEGKKVLVIHPFEDSIRENYEIREKLFLNPDVLPEFELITLKAIQSIADETPEYETWFEALEYMKRRIDEMDFDIALIGAGAYGFPLGAYIKSIGKKAVHIGGMLQLLFGIKGKAWNKLGIYNEYWTSPKEIEKPKGYKSVEAGRYW